MKPSAGKEEKKGSNYCTKGWSWGNYQVSEEQIDFKVGSIPCFGLPFADIANANLTNKNEVTIEFHQDDTAKDA